MRTRLIAVAAALLVLALLVTYQSAAQEPPLPPAIKVDLGEENLLVLACAYATQKAVEEGLVVRWCRRNEPEEVNGYKAKVHVKVAITDYGRFLIDVEFQKSLWWVQSFDVESSP